jgi:hydroxyacylglutathione hydrolase
MLNIEPIKAFQDNYIWMICAPGSDDAFVVDPGDARPVMSALAATGRQLAGILITHHHADHIGGVSTLLSHQDVPVYGPATTRIPQVNQSVAEGDCVSVLGHEFRILEVPGHTIEHIAWFSDDPKLEHPVLFCGDTLFAAGCGRMFEGTAPQMHGSLAKLAALPSDTRVYCAHEYTMSNLRFAGAAMPGNASVQQRAASEQAKRDHAQPTVPSTIGAELDTNPFLRCTDSEILAALTAASRLDGREPWQVFGALRRWKDEF